MRNSLIVLVLFAVLSVEAAFAAQSTDKSPLPTLVIPKLTAVPDFDAFVTMKPSADAIGPLVRVDSFTQRWPDDGKPERMKTIAYLGYTDDAIHVIYLAFDPEPSALRAHLIRREEVFAVNDDAVELRLDTYGDRRQSYYFVSNPLGVQLDAAWPEAGGQYDESFDMVWQSRGQRTKDGFVVMLTIPFRSLRFRPTADQRWGIYLGRWIPRAGEWNFWPPISIRQQSYLAQMAALDGIQGVTRGRGLQLIPYASFRGFRALDQRDRSRPTFVRDLADPNVGLDAKVVVRDALVVDATLNPDFSQVESDAPQITANQRFEVFFPEKRPFFLENAGFLQTPINLMFTRRIADPQVGGKLTGRLDAWSFGALGADDEAPGKRVASQRPRGRFTRAQWRRAGHSQHLRPIERRRHRHPTGGQRPPQHGIGDRHAPARWQGLDRRRATGDQRAATIVGRAGAYGICVLRCHEPQRQNRQRAHRDRWPQRGLRRRSRLRAAHRRSRGHADGLLYGAPRRHLDRLGSVALRGASLGVRRRAARCSCAPGHELQFQALDDILGFRRGLTGHVAAGRCGECVGADVLQARLVGHRREHIAPADMGRYGGRDGGPGDQSQSGGHLRA